MLGMDRQTLKRYAEKGKISAFRHPLTQKIIFPKEEIDLLKVEFLKNNSPTSA
jgi:predicted site-specific integrase-resolvase